MRQYGSVQPPWWDDRPVAIVGGGTSLKGFDLTHLRGLGHVLAVNGSIFDMPWADAGFSLDRPGIVQWWPRFRAVAMPLYLAIPPDWIGRLPQPDLPGATFLRREKGAALSDDPALVHAGSSSGFGALGLAWLKRARRIALFGFDYGPAFTVPTRGRPRPDGWHYNEGRYAEIIRGPGHRRPALWAEWATRFDAIAPVLAAAGVEVVNASPASRITAFPKCSVAAGLDLMQAWSMEAEAA